MSLAPQLRRLSVLFVDDEPSMRHAFSRALIHDGLVCDVTTAADGREACDLLRSRVFDIMICDLTMPGMHGLALLEHARTCYPTMMRVVHSGVVEQFADHTELQRADLVFAKPQLAREIMSEAAKRFS